MAFGVFMHKDGSIYDDIPEAHYQFPKSYLSRAKSMVGDWIVYYEPVKVRNSKGYWAMARVERIEPDGLRSGGRHYPLDVLICATGFDAGTGALTRIDIRGRNGRSLKEEWGQEVRTAMGLQVHGYPNLFTTGAPLAPSAALCNMTTCLQQQVDWITDCILYMEGHGYKVIEASKALQDQWVAHHDETANRTLVVKTDSWYMGTNVAGKPRRLLSYIGGVGTYRQKCDEVAASGYRGFTFA